MQIMVDFSTINVFKLTRFELGSQIRKKHFRFIRYTGNNYAEIVSYIHEISPNTVIWPEKNLSIGTLYNYSGRDFRMNYVDEIGLRAVIVNNPFILVENEWVSLALSRVQAEAYLAMNPAHAVFRPDKPFSTYKKHPENSKVIEYNSVEHPRGLDFDRLRPGKYFICNDVVADSALLDFRYDSRSHDLQIVPDVTQLVDQIEELKYQINMHSMATKKTPIFSPLWNHWRKYKTMSVRCLNRFAVKNIVEVIYSSLMKETRENGIPGKLLEHNKVHTHEFVRMIRNLRFCEFDCNALATPEQQEIYLKYLGNSDGPYCPNDCQKLQLSLYKDYIVFLQYILGRVRKLKKGVIQEAEEGFLFCCDVLLPSAYALYKGCRCEITDYDENSNRDSNYKYFSKCVDKVDVNWQGTVELDKNGAKVVNGYFVPDSFDVEAGDSVVLTQVCPDVLQKWGVYAGVVYQLSRVKHSSDEGDFENSPIRPFIKAKRGPEFLKFLHELLARQKRGKERVFIILAAYDAKKLTYPENKDFVLYDREFPGMFGAFSNWKKYKSLSQYNKEDKFVQELIQAFAPF